MYALDPYGLLGATVDSTPTQVKQAYYALSRLVHPDKGGSAADMIVVHNAYNYVMAQVTEVNRTVSIEDLEERFAAFCREQVSENEPPPFLFGCDTEMEQRFVDATRFHQVFESLSNDLAARSSHSCGYAASMARSEYRDLEGTVPVCPRIYVPDLSIVQSQPSSCSESTTSSFTLFPFETDIITYPEPLTATTDTRMYFSEMVVAPSLGDYGTNCPFEMTDYRTAFTTTREHLPDVSDCVLCQTFEEVSKARLHEETFNYWRTPVG